MRRAIDIISLLPSGCDKSKPKISMMLSIDLQKASDSVPWCYLFTILDRQAFGKCHLHSEYTVLPTQGHCTHERLLYRCPLGHDKGMSSVPFNIMSELLAIAIEDNLNQRSPTYYAEIILSKLHCY